MKISSSIAEFLYKLLDEEQGAVEIQRNDLASRFSCVPSQINYVLSTRFTPERGYLVESRRGGGGYVRISRVNVKRPDFLMHTVNSVGEEISADTAKALIQNLYDYDIISLREARLMLAALCKNCLTDDKTRAMVFKNMLLSLCGAANQTK